jgi:cytoskeleton protein RodZ
VSEQTEPVSAGALGPGAALARRRNEKRLTVDDVSLRLKFAPRQIRSLEADDYDKLPGVTFVRGMIRNYARLLELDAGPLLAEFARRHAPAPVSVDLHDENIPFPTRRTRSTRVYLGLSLVIVAAMAAVVYEWRFGLPTPFKSQAVSAPPASVDVTRVAVVEATPLSDAPGPALQHIGEPQEVQDAPAGVPRLVFEFSGPSWVQVKDRAGKTLHEQLHAAGTTKVVEGEPPFSLVIGNAAHVRLLYRDEPVDLRPHTRVQVARMSLD